MFITPTQITLHLLFVSNVANKTCFYNSLNIIEKEGMLPNFL